MVGTQGHIHTVLSPLRPSMAYLNYPKRLGATEPKRYPNDRHGIQGITLPGGEKGNKTEPLRVFLSVATTLTTKRREETGKCGKLNDLRLLHNPTRYNVKTNEISSYFLFSRIGQIGTHRQ